MDTIYAYRKPNKRMTETFAMHWFVEPVRRAGIAVLAYEPVCFRAFYLTSRFDWHPRTQQYSRLRAYDWFYTSRKERKMMHDPFLERIAVEVSS